MSLSQVCLLLDLLLAGLVSDLAFRAGPDAGYARRFVVGTALGTLVVAAYNLGQWR